MGDVMTLAARAASRARTGRRRPAASPEYSRARTAAIKLVAVRSSSKLILLRHGQSEWNARDLFTGWVNAPLTMAGEQEAGEAGKLLAIHDHLPDVVHTSLQQRSIRTAELAIAACDRDWIAVRRSWRLNSNHYGALQGRQKSAVLAEVGDEQFMAWRRSYDSPPPPLAINHPHSQFSDPRYAAIPPGERPSSESLKDVTARLLPYWLDAIVPDLRTCALRPRGLTWQHSAGLGQAPRQRP